MKVYVEAYGCTLNRGEASEFKEAVAAGGCAITDSPETADVMAVFTCGVIEATERHMLRRLKLLSGRGSGRLMVLGCLGDISPEAVGIAAPGAAVFSVSDAGSALREILADVAASCGGPPEPRSPDFAIGILPIAQGCQGHCTYCATRLARGVLESRRPDVVAARLDRLVAAGSAEIQLCAQDTGAYGRDIGSSLPELLDRLSAQEGDFMLRVGMMNPSSVLRDIDALVNAFRSERVFKFLHLPVQSGSGRILDAMGRGYAAEDFERIVAAFRKRFPGMTLSTDVIVGFPGETDEDFAMSAELLARIEPDVVNVTRFSPRPGTAASAMRGQVHGRVAKERSRALTELRFRILEEKQAGFIGRTFRALATERRSPGTTFMRTLDYRPVVVSGEAELGRWYEVEITGAARTHLTGRPV